MCLLEKKKITHPVTSCNDLANEGCEVFKHFPVNTSLTGMKIQYNTLVSKVDFLKATIEPMNKAINGNHFTMNTIEPITSFLCVGASIAAVIGLIYYGVSYNNVGAEYHKDTKNVQMVKNRIKDLPHSDRILEMTSRLGINMENVTIKRFIEQLKSEDEKINARWKHRVAFLGGSVRKEATTYNFFKNDGARDLSRRIIEEAGLGPVRLPGLALI